MAQPSMQQDMRSTTMNNTRQNVSKPVIGIFSFELKTQAEVSPDALLALQRGSSPGVAASLPSELVILVGKLRATSPERADLYPCIRYRVGSFLVCVEFVGAANPCFVHVNFSVIAS